MANEKQGLKKKTKNKEIELHPVSIQELNEVIRKMLNAKKQKKNGKKYNNRSS